MKRQELDGVTRKEVKDFVLSLTNNETSLYSVQWDILLREALYIKGYRRDGKLVGIAGITRKFLISYLSFRIVKEEYWRQGIGV